ncbi:hypothetical protein LRD18_08910 [Halorhodospira halochloris]|uniref:Uncharacterized protein n=1 Tax=Halorhodospira halochloris TaxID=1052 RepID=A0A110B4P8_HALHR|nr:hypothetical protein [Halorhodospira halochloris]MBK1651560.1 hypothetical protein [Halorhodospira halochloris]MCG5530990.1 hypothetical protein [Halorhodospira halochloris]MCG5548771.1 hypothetical protein [Halorhodospira halochloris]BAU57173.1 hypothetical protein HH1059_04900 [Halorhodospira halochloris]
MNDPFMPKGDEPPLLYDLVMSGERVRNAGGPWLGIEGQDSGLLSAPPPPSLKALWEGQGTLDPTPTNAAEQNSQPTPHQPEEPAASREPQTVAEVPAELRAEIERQACRTLAKHFRQQIAERLDEAIQQSRQPIRKAVEDALVSAVSSTRKNQ